MWQNESVFYQIYPLGFCGAPKENDGITSRRIEKLFDWVDYLADFGVNAVLLNPLFESDKHGYDTRDFFKVDCRLGTNDDLKKLTEAFSKRDIKVVFDGVFNHVGRGFWAFQDVLKNRENSPFKHWFNIRFDQNNGYNDGLSYEGWEGHYELVKLNLRNTEVIDHIFSAIRMWILEFGIDGLRLDVAYCLDKDFLRRLRSYCDSLKADFCLIGEVLFGDYNQIVNDSMLHSCTNYECYKGLYSSLNSLNLYEISYSLNRQFGLEPWTLYKNKHLLSFVDNHDVSRLASILSNKSHIPLAYGLLFAFPGIPSIYYGSEWGMLGEKHNGDDALRPTMTNPERSELSSLISRLISLRRHSRTLCYGSYKNITQTNRQLVFERSYENEKIWFAINLDSNPFSFNLGSQTLQNMLSGEPVNLNPLTLDPYSFVFLKH